MSSRLFSVLLSQSLQRLFSYRVNFWLNFWGSAVTEVLIAYILWASIYEAQGQESFGGFNFTQMMLYYLFVSFIGRTLRGAENYEVSTDIYEGRLTRFLLYPHNYFLFKYADHLAYTIIGVLQAILACGAVLLFYPEALSYLNLDFLSFLQLIVFVFLASGFFFVLMTVLELVAFWADNIWSLLVMARFALSFLGGLYLPLSLFPEPMQALLFYTPFPAMTYLPVQYIMGQVSGAELLNGFLVLCFWTLFIMASIAIVWARGKYKFSGVGQ